MNAVADPHRRLPDDHLEPVGPRGVWRNKLVQANVRARRPLPVQREKSLPIFRFHPPARDDVFASRQRLLCPHILVLQQRHNPAKRDTHSADED